MTKWFDTNYHYVVPEITAPVTAFRPLPWREPMEGEARPGSSSAHTRSPA